MFTNCCGGKLAANFYTCIQGHIRFAKLTADNNNAWELHPDEIKMLENNAPPKS